MKLLFIDTETGGLDCNTHSLLSLSALVWNDGNIVDSYNEIICSNTISITRSAYHVHNLNLETVFKGKNIVMARHEFVDFIGKNFNKTPIFAGQNVIFDINFLKANKFINDRYYRFTDTMCIARFLQAAGKLPETLKCSLKSLCEHYDIDNLIEHDAYYDNLTTIKVFERMMNDIRY